MRMIGTVNTGPEMAHLLAQADSKGVGYLTIDECEVPAGQTQRRPGLHVDGIYRGAAGSWGGGGSWGGTGFLVANNIPGTCRAWDTDILGKPGPEGECEHLRPKFPGAEAVLMSANKVYDLDPLTVHEALPVHKDCRRQFVRVSRPSDAPWFEGYTPNPLGVKPAGPILPPREFLAYRGEAASAAK